MDRFDLFDDLAVFAGVAEDGKVLAAKDGACADRRILCGSVLASPGWDVRFASRLAGLCVTISKKRMDASSSARDFGGAGSISGSAGAKIESAASPVGDRPAPSEAVKESGVSLSSVFFDIVLRHRRGGWEKVMTRPARTRALSESYRLRGFAGSGESLRVTIKMR